MNNHKPLRLATTLVYMLLCFFERPAWCYSDEHQCLAGDPPAPPPMWSLPMASTTTTCTIELACLSVWAADMCIDAFVRAAPGAAAFREGLRWAWGSGRLPVILLAVADMAWTALDPEHFRWGKYVGTPC